jgi:cytidine deaminase
MLANAVAAAKLARHNAHAPYSKYTVGSAVVTRDGQIFAGCNFENASYGATICAERNAIGHMVAAGARDPVLCVVVTRGPEPAAPCGVCRQVLREFARDMRVLMIAVPPGSEQVVRESSLASLLPEAFSPEDLDAAPLPPPGPRRSPSVRGSTRSSTKSAAPPPPAPKAARKPKAKAKSKAKRGSKRA